MLHQLQHYLDLNSAGKGKRGGGWGEEKKRNVVVVVVCIYYTLAA